MGKNMMVGMSAAQFQVTRRFYRVIYGLKRG